MKLKIFLISLLLSACVKEQNTQGSLIFYVIGDWGKMGIPNQQLVASQMKDRKSVV